jgi:hypothetical protein
MSTQKMMQNAIVTVFGQIANFALFKCARDRAGDHYLH